MMRHEEAWKIKKVAILGSRHKNVAALVRAYTSDPIHIGLLVTYLRLKTNHKHKCKKTKSQMEAYEQMRHLHTLSCLSSAPFWNPMGREEEMKTTGNFRSTQAKYKRPTNASLSGKVRR
ncbi:hypothetical protein CSPX01_00080 [Colletotrichum filicis]|nr:hypothetical protein CSPX01_00080 [Colletotrichum filicis]